MSQDSKDRAGWRRYVTKRNILWSIGAVVVLALVVLGASALSSPKSETNQADSTVARIESLNKLAADALASGETTAAQEYIARSVALDAANEDTKRLVAQVEQATKTSSNSNSDDSQDSDDSDDSDSDDEDPTDPPTTDEAYLKGYDDLTVFLPESAMSGFTLGTPDGDSFSATVMELPSSSQGVERVVLTVFDQKTEAKAQAFVDDIDKAYPLNVASVSVGSRQGRFGTSADGLASMAFARGRYSFEVVLLPKGATKDQLKSIAVSVGATFPAAK